MPEFLSKTLSLLRKVLRVHAGGWSMRYVWILRDEGQIVVQEVGESRSFMMNSSVLIETIFVSMLLGAVLLLAVRDFLVRCRVLWRHC